MRIPVLEMANLQSSSTILSDEMLKVSYVKLVISSWNSTRLIKALFLMQIIRGDQCEAEKHQLYDNSLQRYMVLQSYMLAVYHDYAR